VTATSSILSRYLRKPTSGTPVEWIKLHRFSPYRLLKIGSCDRCGDTSSPTIWWNVTTLRPRCFGCFGASALNRKERGHEHRGASGLKTRDLVRFADPISEIDIDSNGRGV
jgi:hypothetical protein